MSSPTLEQLKRDLTRLGQARSALTKAGTSAELVDQTGHVQVEVDGAGRITHLRIGNRWKEDIPVEVLGATILSVPTQAALRATIDAVKATCEELGGKRQGPEPTEVPATLYDFPPSAASELSETILRLSRETETFQTLPPEQRYREPAEVLDEDQPRSTNGQVVAKVTDGRVVDLLIDADWAARAVTQSITNSVLEALEKAYQQIDEAQESGGTEETRLGPEGQSIRADIAKINEILASYRRS